MLQLLKETVSSRHAERLETIVIWLIVVEIGERADATNADLRQCTQFQPLEQVWESSPFWLISSRDQRTCSVSFIPCYSLYHETGLYCTHGYLTYFVTVIRRSRTE